MGYQDRDYRKESLEPPTYIPMPRMPEVIWLIILCSLLSLIEWDKNLKFLTDISFNSIFNQGHLWAIIMAPFAPDFFWSALCHCLALYYIGRRFIQTDGFFEFLALYVVSALIGMIFYWVVLKISPSNENLLSQNLDAATWSLCGMAMVFAVRYPTEKILLYFILPIQIKLLMTGVVVIVLLTMASHHRPLAEYMPLLGSLGFGFLYGFKNIRLTSLWSKWKRFFGKARLPVLGGNQLKDMSEDEIKKEIDRILDKITEKGAPSLTAKERDFLMKSSKRHQ